MRTDSPAQVLDAAATRSVLDFRPLLAEIEHAALQLDDGLIRCPERLVVPLAEGGLLLSMPAVAADLAIHKLITVIPGNPARGLPTITGQVTVLDATTGSALLTLDGPTVTGRRTAAISMLALRTLKPAAPRHILLIGTGSQAQHHVEAIAALHPNAKVTVRGRTAAAAERFCDHNALRGMDLSCSESSSHPDVVITCTTSRQPVYFDAADASRLVIAVGAFQPGAAEIAAPTVRASSVVVDDPRGARHEAGDLILAGIEWDLVRSLANALRHGAPPGGPLLFKSVGCAAWDLAAARCALTRLDGGLSTA